MAKWNGYWINAPESKQVDKEKEFLDHLLARIDYMCQAKLSKRELFGMAAMQGLIGKLEKSSKDDELEQMEIIPVLAYYLADAMIAQGKKE